MEPSSRSHFPGGRMTEGPPRLCSPCQLCKGLHCDCITGPFPQAMPFMPTFPTRPSLRTLLPANSHLGICRPGNRYRYSPHPHKPTHHRPYLSFLSQPNILEEELQLLASCLPVAHGLRLTPQPRRRVLQPTCWTSIGLIPGHCPL